MQHNYISALIDRRTRKFYVPKRATGGKERLHGVGAEKGKVHSDCYYMSLL